MPHFANDQAPALSDEQFAKLVELLTPGYECAKLMLADYQRQQSEREARELEHKMAEEEAAEAARKAAMKADQADKA